VLCRVVCNRVTTVTVQCSAFRVCCLHVAVRLYAGGCVELLSEHVVYFPVNAPELKKRTRSISTVLACHSCMHAHSFFAALLSRFPSFFLSSFPFLYDFYMCRRSARRSAWIIAQAATASLLVIAPTSAVATTTMATFRTLRGASPRARASN